jgi:hypothetical protein
MPSRNPVVIAAWIGAAAVIAAALIALFPQYWRSPATQESPGHLIRFGIPDNATLDTARQVVGGKLNVSIVFSPGCSQKAKQATLDGAQIEGDSKDPAAIIRALLPRVKDNTIRYEVSEIEPLRRYEIRCF